MCKKIIVVSMFLCSSFFVLSSCTKDEKAGAREVAVSEHSHEGHHHEMKESGSHDQVTNKTCPVSGDEVDPAVSTTYKGKKVYFCCKDCIDDFLKEPEKYRHKLPQFKSAQ
jgi:YHS domain-containing protein